MKQDRLLDFALSFLDRRPRGYASRKIRHVSGVVPVSFFDNYRVSHSIAYRLSPACLRILFNVPGGKSSLGFPATVTRPVLLGCLNWRWLPRVATWIQPSRRSIPSTSDTFMTRSFPPEQATGGRRTG